MKPNIFIEENFVENANGFFNKLKSEVVWDKIMEARNIASFGVSNDYSGITYLQTEMFKDLIPRWCSKSNAVAFSIATSCS